MLYLYPFECSPPDDGLVEAETCRRHIVNDKLLLVIYCVICWIKYCIQTIARIVGHIKFVPVLLCVKVT